MLGPSPETLSRGSLAWLQRTKVAVPPSTSAWGFRCALCASLGGVVGSHGGRIAGRVERAAIASFAQAAVFHPAKLAPSRSTSPRRILRRLSSRTSGGRGGAEQSTMDASTGAATRTPTARPGRRATRSSPPPICASAASACHGCASGRKSGEAVACAPLVSRSTHSSLGGSSRRPKRPRPPPWRRSLALLRPRARHRQRSSRGPPTSSGADLVPAIGTRERENPT